MSNRNYTTILLYCLILAIYNYTNIVQIKKKNTYNCQLLFPDNTCSYQSKLIYNMENLWPICIFI